MYKELIFLHFPVDDLISCIQTDIRKSREKLDILAPQYREKESWGEFA